MSEEIKGAASSHLFFRVGREFIFYNDGSLGKTAAVLMWYIFIEVIYMKVNTIGFKLSSETFGGDRHPTDVVEIYVDGENLSDIISCGLPLWPSELYPNLMRAFSLEGEPVNIFVCGCGCVGCGDTSVEIEETENFVIWHDFFHFHPIESGRIFVFDKAQYYAEVDNILKWKEEERLAFYIGNVFTVWSDEMRLRFLAERLSDSCILKSDFSRNRYVGKEEVLDVMRRRLLAGDYKRKEIENYLYRLGDCYGETEGSGYQNLYLSLCHHQNSQDVVMYVLFKTDAEGKISEIFLTRNEMLLTKDKARFYPLQWASEFPVEF